MQANQARASQRAGHGGAHHGARHQQRMANKQARKATRDLAHGNVAGFVAHEASALRHQGKANRRRRNRGR